MKRKSRRSLIPKPRRFLEEKKIRFFVPAKNNRKMHLKLVSVFPHLLILIFLSCFGIFFASRLFSGTNRQFVFFFGQILCSMTLGRHICGVLCIPNFLCLCFSPLFFNTCWESGGRRCFSSSIVSEGGFLKEKTHGFHIPFETSVY